MATRRSGSVGNDLISDEARDVRGDTGGKRGEALNARSRASVRFGWGRARFEADVDVTPTTMLAIGGMVGMILLAVVPIVQAGGRAARRRPW